MPLHILIIDPSPDNRRFMNDVLQAHKYHTTQVASLSEAEQALSQKSFALLIVDLSLLSPDDEGWIAERLRASPALSIIGMSARIPAHGTAYAVSLGCGDFLAKPFAIRPFIKAVEEALGTPSLL